MTSSVIIRTSSRTIPTRAGASLTNAVALIRRAVDSGVVKTAGRVEKAALIRVPVRKVFKGGRRTSPVRRTLADATAEVAAFMEAFPTQPKTGLRTTRGQAYNALLASQTSEGATRNRANYALGNNPNRDVHIIETAPHYLKPGDKGYRFGSGNASLNYRPLSRVGALSDPYIQKFLTSQGRYELLGPGGAGIGRAVQAGRAKKGESAGSSQTVQGELGTAGTLRLGGALKDSIELLTDSTDTLRGYIVKAGGKDAPYARYVEFGTRHAAAQPFLRPALAEHSEELVGDIIAALERNAGLQVGKGR